MIQEDEVVNEIMSQVTTVVDGQSKIHHITLNVYHMFTDSKITIGNVTDMQVALSYMYV